MERVFYFIIDCAMENYRERHTSQSLPLRENDYDRRQRWPEHFVVPPSRGEVKISPPLEFGLAS